ncbi:hypothetical protein AB6A40_004494 [Gnathostoma spinigerum]|uniref:Uncharacterized protein n=1 Tax=Gnathostoma spinigerum TaxID=75299 RepID=A0ABD6EDS8_9BILA
MQPVIVVKPNEKFRMCTGVKVAISQNLRVNPCYKSPITELFVILEDVMERLSKRFIAYQQTKMDENIRSF